MSGKSIEITYRLVLNPQEQQVFRVQIDTATLEHEKAQDQDLPAWTSLQFHSCSHCPLPREGVTHCPAAVSLVSLVESCDKLLSYSEVQVTVETPERVLSKTCSAQKALSSLVGLRMATSGCPRMSILKPMARFHLPFATREETIFRAASAYLLGQWFLRQQGQEQDLELHRFQEAYDAIHVVNMGMAARLRTIAQGDASINAIVLLDLFAHSMPLAAEEKLKTLRYLYTDQLRAQEPVPEPLQSP
jgi:hypothetical protein